MAMTSNVSDGRVKVWNSAKALETLDTHALQWSLPQHMYILPVWSTSQPDLTVDDLADSIEAMLARRASGLAQPAAMSAMRVYPTDPSTVVTATDMLKQIQSEGKQELETLNKQIADDAKNKQIADAKAKKEAEEFAAFQAAKTKTV